ncbi:hypothetical protein [Variovorax sp. PBL-E5]|uniref:hypothetical protein n=1 Tax=Variovorax sp. PBL-E5 TaxID=434014 RepID=UPI0013A59FF3|nr:hypothetical protein [Variovorax sp. PBL-E5]
MAHLKKECQMERFPPSGLRRSARRASIKLTRTTSMNRDALFCDLRGVTKSTSTSGGECAASPDENESSFDEAKRDLAS